MPTEEAQEKNLLQFPSEIQNVRNACYSNAESHLASADVLVDKGQYSAAYHFSVLALEETGKAELVVMNWLAQISKEEHRYKNWMDDHIKKLFWCLWGPCFGNEVISNEQIKTYQGLAKNIHNNRLGSLYVDVLGENPTILNLEENEVRNIIELSHARLEMSKLYDVAQEIPDGRREILRWFLTAPDDPEKKKFIFSGVAQNKLVELQDMWEWVKWIHAECVKAEEVAQEMARKELNRQFPRTSEQDDPKWRLRVRLLSPSHSIRKKELKKWNQDDSCIKLEAVDKRPNELIVDFILPKSFPVHAFWDTGFGLVRRYVAALNIGTCGFFWFHKADHTSKFYDSIYDYENENEIHVERSPKLEVDWGHHVLTSDRLTDVSTCFVELPTPNNRHEHNPFDWYLTGIAHIAKTDVHVPMVIDAFRAFYMAWKSGSIQYGEILENTDYPEALGAYWGDLFPREEEDREKYMRLARGIEEGKPDRDNITLTEAGCMKVLCDTRFIQIFRRLLKDRFANDVNDNQPSEDI